MAADHLLEDGNRPQARGGLEEWDDALNATAPQGSAAVEGRGLIRFAKWQQIGATAALALVQGLEPENEAQAALAINAACLHAASANVMSRLSTGGGDRRVTRRGWFRGRWAWCLQAVSLLFEIDPCRTRHIKSKRLNGQKVDVR